MAILTAAIIVMAVRIDETRREDQALGIDNGLARQGCEIADSHYTVAIESDRSLDAVTAGSIINGRTYDDRTRN